MTDIGSHLTVEHRTESCVAYLDILGFRYLVDRRGDLGSLSKAVLDLLDGDDTKRIAKEFAIDYAIFSDSVLAKTIGTHPKYRELEQMVRFCACLFAQSVLARLPMRGAIAWGLVHWDKERDIRIGSPINEAVDWEGKQDWAGVMLAGSAMAYMNQHHGCRETLGELLFPLDKAFLPLRNSDRCIKAGVVRPHVATASQYRRLSEILRELGLESCNLEVQEKLDATADVLERFPPQGLL